MGLSIGLAVAGLLPRLVGAMDIANTAISRHIPDCAKPCLAEALQEAQCSETDLDCICPLAWGSPALNSCSMASCDIAQALATINGTATACDRPVSGQSLALLLSTVILGAVSIVCVGVRLLGRPKARSQWLQRADDWMIGCNAIFVIGMMACTIIAHGNGYGKDTWTLPTRQIRTILKLIYSLQILYTVIIHLTKISILYFYLQFFPFTVFPRLRTAIYATMAVTVAMAVSFTMAITFQCTPIDSNWKKFDENIPLSDQGSWRCINLPVYGFVGSSLQLLLDLWLMALPMPELLKLSLPVRKKIAVCLMFAVGSFVTVVTIPRVIYMSYFKHTPNPTHDLVLVSTWGHVESLTSVILACTPSICIVLARLYRRRRGDPPILLQDQESPGANRGHDLAHLDRSTGLSGSTEAGSKGAWVERLVPKDRLDLSGASACSTLYEEAPR